MPPPEKPRASGKNELLSAFDQVVDREKKKAGGVGLPPRVRRTSVAVIGLGVVAWGWLGYAWLSKPAWLFSPDQGGSRSVAEQEATLRFGMYLEAERVRDYFDANRRLPESLNDAGDVEEGMEYEIKGDSEFVITGTAGTTTLRLASGDNVQSFLESTGMKPALRGQ